jgi:hypothetical protein
MINRLKCWFCCFLFGLSACVSTSSTGPVVMPSGVEPNCGVRQLEKLANQIDRDAGASPRIWAEIANDARYTADERTFALRVIFRDYVRTGMRIIEIGAVLDGAQWLDEQNITQLINPNVPGVLEAFHGKQGAVLKIVPNFSENTSNPFAILFCFNRDIDERLVFEYLKGNAIAAEHRNIKLSAVQVF